MARRPDARSSKLSDSLAGRKCVSTITAAARCIVNFWATWCAPCVAEMPSLQRLRDKLGAQRRRGDRRELQENAARIQPFVERLRPRRFRSCATTTAALRTAWGVDVFPTTFVVGPDQRVALVAVGESRLGRRAQ